jgi:2-methylcitrate dehydratase PrpD
MDPSKKFTTPFVSARFEDLSPEVVEAVRMTVLDTAGAALAGSSSASCRWWITWKT